MGVDPDYELFARVVEEGSLSAAGRAMLISPAMVSKRIARLEERLGARLLHRTTRKLALTRAGEQFHEDVVRILAAVRAAEARLTGATAEPAGILRASAPSSFGRMHIAPHLHRFLEAYPRIKLELHLSDTFVDLLTERFDLAIRITRDIPPSLAAHRLGRSRRVLCASPDYLTRHGAPADVKDLMKHPLLAATGQMPWRLVNGSRQITVERESSVITNSSDIVRELALTGCGIALRSLWDVSSILANHALVRILPDWEGSADVGIYAVYPRSPIVPTSASVFISFLKANLNVPGS